MHRSVHLKYQQKTEHSEVIGLIPFTDRPQNWLLANSWGRYCIITFSIKHPSQSQMEVIGGAKMKPYEHRVDAPLRPEWDLSSIILTFNKINSSLCSFSTLGKILTKWLYQDYSGKKKKSPWSIARSCGIIVKSTVTILFIWS